MSRAYKAGERVSTNEFQGTVTYAVGNGRFIDLDLNTVRRYGAATLLRAYVPGYEPPTERLPVIHHGRRIGTMAPDFDPDNVKSNSPWYDARPGDFVREGDTWVANRTLGASDPDCVVGFLRDARY